MDSFEVLIYIIFGVIYLLSRALKKKKKPSAPRPQMESDDEVVTQDAPVTFEDLLKELTGAQTPKPKTQPKPQQRYDRSDPAEYEDLREQRRPVADDSRSREVYESARRSAKDIKTIDELVDLEKGIEPSGRFEEFKIEKQFTKGDEIRGMLQNKQDAQKAIILAEILNRKY